MLIPRGDVGCGSVVTLLFHLHLRTGFYFLAAVSVTFWGCLVCVQMQPVLIWQSTWLHGCGADHARQRAKKPPSQKHIPERLDIRVVVKAEAQFGVLLSSVDISIVFQTKTVRSRFTSAWQFSTWEPSTAAV